jgi:DNA invertase Pin-like site-specific DNA recombinase
MFLIGYARISTHAQDLSLQLDKLKEKGCTKIFTDKISGAITEREELEHALAYLREGDMLLVWKLDRLGRSLKHLIETITTLQARGLGSNAASPHARGFHSLALVRTHCGHRRLGLEKRSDLRHDFG